MTPRFGLVLLEERIDLDNLDSSSSYGQSNSVPGHATYVGDWRPHVVNAQDVEVTVRAVTPGYPGKAGAEVLYTPDGGTDWRSWETPEVWSGVRTPNTDAWSSTADWFSSTIVAIDGLEQLVLWAVEDGIGSQAADMWMYMPRIEEWYNSAFTVDWTSIADGAAAPIAITYDPVQEALIAYHGPGIGSSGTRYASNWVAYRCELQDLPSGWTIYARDVITETTLDPPATTGDATTMHVRAAVENDWLMVIDGTWAGSPDFKGAKQYVSSDRGASFTLVAGTGTDDTLADMESVHPVKLVDSPGFLVAHLDKAASDEFIVRALAAASSPIEDANPITVDDSRAYEQVRLCVDRDGVVYGFGRGTDKIWYGFTSFDNGVTWQAMLSELTAGDANHWFRMDEVVAAAGSLWASGRWETTSGTMDGAVCVLQFGGWTNVRLAQGAGRPVSDLVTGNDPRFYVPAEEPDDMGWTVSTAGSPTVALSPIEGPGLETSGASGDSYTAESPNTGSSEHEAVVMDAQVYVHTTGTDSGSSGNDTGGIQCSAVDTQPTPTAAYEAAIRIFDDELEVRDVVNNSVVAQDTGLSLAGKTIRLRLAVYADGSAGKVSAWYRIEGESFEWTTIVKDGALVSRGTDLVSTGTFGINGGGDAHFVWRYVGKINGRPSHDLDLIGEVFDLEVGSRVPGLFDGKALPGGALRYPVLELTDEHSSTTNRHEVGFLRGRAGPTYYSESVVLPVGYENGIGNALLASSPSPREQWRQDDTTAATLVFDVGSDVWLGNVLALVVLNADFRTALLEIDDGAGGWTTLGTLDKGWGSLGWTRSGRSVRPNTGTTAIDRYFHENELADAGAYMITETGRVERIVRNSAGYWTDTSGVQQLELELEGDPGGGTSGSSGVLVHGAGVACFAVPSAPLARDQVRVTIAASQETPADDYRAGLIAIGRVLGIGADPSWSYRQTLEMTRVLSRRTDQFLEVRQTGPARRILDYDWPDGVFLRELHNEADDPESVAFAGGAPIGTKEDAGTVLMQAVAGRMKAGQVPCVVIPQLGTLGDTITDPFRYLYGRVRSERIGYQGLVGTEGVDEVVRVDGLTFEELR